MTSSLVTRIEAISLASISSSQETFLAVILTTTLYTTSRNDKDASSILLAHSNTPSPMAFNFTKARSPLHLYAT